MFKNTATRATEYANAAKTMGSALLGSFAGFGAKKATTPAPEATTSAPATGWGKWAPAAYAVGGAVLAGAAAGGAYYKREDLGVGYTWATDHMKYVRNLWDEAALNKRVDDLLDIEDQEGVVFRVWVSRPCSKSLDINHDNRFYTYLPPVPLMNSNARTFVVLPKRNARSANNFVPAKNGIAPDELQAHTGMFSAKTNDGYYELGLETVKVIREAVMLGRGIFEDPNTIDATLEEEGRKNEEETLASSS